MKYSDKQRLSYEMQDPEIYFARIVQDNGLKILMKNHSVKLENIQTFSSYGMRSDNLANKCEHGETSKGSILLAFQTFKKALYSRPTLILF